MKRYTYYVPKEINTNNMYIITRPTQTTDLTVKDLHISADEDAWIEKAKHLQARRWRRIKHQLA